MTKLKFIGKKFLKLILKILWFVWLFLLVSNIMRLFYNYIWRFISFMYDLYLEKKVVYADISSKISNETNSQLKEKIFIEDCNFGQDQWGYGRFLPHIDKICISATGDNYVINHELMHYKLRNLTIAQKLTMREKIVTQISNIKKAMNMNNLDQLTWDNKEFFDILSGSIVKYAEDSTYKFYDRIPNIAISHWGNEEYITYAVWNLVELDDEKKMYLLQFNLTNPLLKTIQDGYLDIYKQLVPIYTKEINIAKKP